jgi:hypothetical protein
MMRDFMPERNSEQPPSGVIASAQAFSHEAEGRDGKRSSALFFRTLRIATSLRSEQ